MENTITKNHHPILAAPVLIVGVLLGSLMRDGLSAAGAVEVLVLAEAVAVQLAAADDLWAVAEDWAEAEAADRPVVLSAAAWAGVAALVVVSVASFLLLVLDRRLADRQG